MTLLGVLLEGSKGGACCIGRSGAAFNFIAGHIDPIWCAPDPSAMPRARRPLPRRSHRPEDQYGKQVLSGPHPQFEMLRQFAGDGSSDQLD